MFALLAPSTGCCNWKEPIEKRRLFDIKESLTYTPARDFYLKGAAEMADEKTAILHQLSFLEGAESDVVEHLAERAAEKCFQPGNVIAGAA